MEITVNNVNITLTPEQIAQICKEAKPEFDYPIFKRSTSNGKIVKFTSLNNGEVVWQQDSSEPIGHTDEYKRHTSTTYWQDVAYDTEQGLWDGQPVYCWGDIYTHACSIGFYDVVHKCRYDFEGKRSGTRYSNYEAIDPANYTPWMLKAFTTLQH